MTHRSRTLRSLFLLLAIGGVALLARPASAATGELYWSQTDTPLVGRVNADGGGAASTLPRAHSPVGLTVVSETGQVYWYESTLGIVRSDVQLTSPTTVVSGLGGALNLAVDPAQNLVFWTSGDGGTIGRANLSSGAIVGTFSSPGQVPDDITVDPQQQRVYWVTQSGGVYRANYDGSARQTLIPESTLGSGSTGIDLDVANNTMYLAYPNTNRIVKAALDGTGPTTLLTVPERPFGMELFDGRLYWADIDGGALRSAAINGTDVKTLLSGLNGPRAVDVLPTPEPGCLWLGGLLGALALRRGRGA